MYTIEYYKTKKEKPVIEEPKYYNDKDKRYNYLITLNYLHKKDLIEKCWNVKSVTIDLDDIKQIVNCDKEKSLFGLFARVSRLDLEDIESITINNNNIINERYIYEIISSDWLVNKNEKPDNYNVLKEEKEAELNTLIKEYEKLEYKEINERNKKIKLDRKIKRIKYYLNTLDNIGTKEETKPKKLVLNSHFSKKDVI